MTRRGTLILVVGPSGSGKNTLIDAAREACPDLAFSVSATTRPMREGEIDGIHYHFLSKEEFERRVEADEFLEWAPYGGNLYGTLRSEIEPKLAAGETILGDIEVQGARQVRDRLPEGELETVYIDAGSWEELAARIRARAPMDDETLAKRKARYEDESDFKREADHVISNRDGELASAKHALIGLIKHLRDA